MPVYTKLFVAFFLAIFFINYIKHLSIRLSNVLLFLASLIFYAWSGVVFVPVIIGFGLVTYASGFIIEKLGADSKYDSIRKAVMIVFVAVELLPICIVRVLGVIFRYSNHKEMLIPLGLSFFSLQIVTYTVGVYKKKIPAEKDILNILLFVCFFPCVSSGPIQRAENLIPQIKKEKAFDYERAVRGLILMAWGFMKKLVLADNLALYIDSVRGAEGEKYGTALLLTVILYSFRLYFDFSGYSDIVTGCAKAIGYDIGKNFDHPYLSHSVGEFWRRWHISLSSWLRDYVYIPLGGSRTREWKIYRNLIITFAISGIWHGAGITWILWGLFHGICLCFERAFGSKNKEKSAFSVFTTFILVTFGWIIFSVDTLGEAVSIIASFSRIPNELFSVMPKLLGSGLTISAALRELLMVPASFSMSVMLAGIVIYMVISVITYKRPGIDILREKKSVVRWSAYFALILIILFLGQAGVEEFVYNRF